MRIGDKIRTKRIQMGLNQTELARLLEIDQKSVSNWEGNKNLPNELSIPKIAAVLGIPITELTETPDIYKDVEIKKAESNEENKIMKLIDALHAAGAITADHIDNATRDVIINTIQKYIKEKENRED